MESCGIRASIPSIHRKPKRDHSECSAPIAIALVKPSGTPICWRASPFKNLERSVEVDLTERVDAL
jgi:hypothetical protein